MEYTIVGIDFGTSTTVVKLKNYHAGMNPRDCQPLTFNGNSTVPTLIFEDENKQLFFGYEAESQVLAGTPGTLYENFKMDLLGDKTKREKAQKLILEFFKYIYSELNQNRQRLNMFPTVKTYISYPAKWTSETRSFMKECAVKAGFGVSDNVLGESEPTAAIYSSLLFHSEELQNEKILIKNQPLNVMMIDMGAGTSDIAIFKFKIDSNNNPSIDEIITYPTVDNVYLCGGREIDTCLEKHLCDFVQQSTIDNNIPDGINKAIHDSVKPWKERNVSPNLEENKTIGSPGQLLTPLNILRQCNVLRNVKFENIDRKKFELLTETHWKQLHSLISDSIMEAKNKLHNFNGAEDIDLVIMTGGHSQWYGVKDFILGKDFASLSPINFAKIKKQPGRLVQEKHPQETVAHGLVYKDVKFDIKHTMGNSLWMMYEIEGSKSSMFSICKHNDVLPLSINNEWEYKVNSSYLRSKSIPIKCSFYYGSSQASAKHYNINKNLEVPDTVLRYFVGIVIGSPILAMQFLWDWANHSWDYAVKGSQAFYDHSFTVKLKTKTMIGEDETVCINGTIRISESDSIGFNLKI